MSDLTFNTSAGEAVSRKLLVLYLNTGESGTPVWSAIGKRVEDSSMSYDAFYTTSSDHVGWRKSSDNAHGGLDVFWAHQENNSAIVRNAPLRYVEQLLNALQQAADEEFDADQLQALHDIYTELYY